MPYSTKNYLSPLISPSNSVSYSLPPVYPSMQTLLQSSMSLTMSTISGSINHKSFQQMAIDSSLP
jgi:hypothetical protein